MPGGRSRTNAGPAPEALAATIGTAILAADALGLERTRAALAEALRQLDAEAPDDFNPVGVGPGGGPRRFARRSGRTTAADDGPQN